MVLGHQRDDMNETFFINLTNAGGTAQIVIKEKGNLFIVTSIWPMWLRKPARRPLRR